MTSCKKRGAELQNPPTGRPPDYCSVACRRLAEFEVRRLTRQLDSLEAQRLHLEQPGITVSRMYDAYGRSHRKQLTDVRHSIQTVETRLRALLGDEPSKNREIL